MLHDLETVAAPNGSPISQIEQEFNARLLHLTPKEIPLEVIKSTPKTDKGMAQLVLRRHEGRIAIVKKWASDPVFIYSSKSRRWTPEASHILRGLVTETAEFCQRKIEGWEPKASNGDKQEELLKHKKAARAFYISFQNNAKRRSCASVIEDEESIQSPKSEWENRDLELHFDCGHKLNLKTGERGITLPTDKVLKAAPFPLPPDLDQDVSDTLPVRVIRQIFEGADEQLEYFRQALFSTLMGRKDDKVFFYLQGDADCGKTVLMVMMRALLGTYSEVADFMVIQAVERGLEHRFTMQKFENIRMMIIDETGDEGKYIDARAIKAFTSGFEIECEEKNRPRSSYRPKFSIWITSNNDPRLIKDDGAVKRRLRLFRLKRRFSLSEQREEYKTVEFWTPHLQDLFRWIWQARDVYWANRLKNIPGVMQTAIDENAEENDWLGQMLREIAKVGDGHCDLSSLWIVAKRWLAINHAARARMNRAAFKSELRAKGFRVDRNNVCHGISLLDLDEMPAIYLAQ